MSYTPPPQPDSPEKLRVRFAPSPTGYLHVGGARTALFNWLFARHHGGEFRLRIENTDTSREVAEAVDQIQGTLAWLGLDWDGEVTFQLDRMEHAQEVARRFVDGPDGRRLSKRHGATSVEEFRDQGYLAETLVNYLALLGWSYDDRTEVMTREELVERFTLDRVGASAATFDYKKLEWLNGVY